MKKKVFSYFHPVKWIFFCFGKVSKNQFDSVFFSCREAFPSILWKLLMLIFEKRKTKNFSEKIQNIIGSISFSFKKFFPFQFFVFVTNIVVIGFILWLPNNDDNFFFSTILFCYKKKKFATFFFVCFKSRWWWWWWWWWWW